MGFYLSFSSNVIVRKAMSKSTFSVWCAFSILWTCLFCVLMRNDEGRSEELYLWWHNNSCKNIQTQACLVPTHTQTHPGQYRQIQAHNRGNDMRERKSTAKGCAITLFALIVSAEACDELRWTRKINRIYTSLLYYLFCISIFLFYSMMY